MGRKEKINEAKVIYDIELSAMQNDVERWKKFLEFSSEFYKYTFIENLLMFAQRHDVTMCATMEQWNSVGRWVNKGAKGIRLIDNRDDEIALKYVFDVTDTHGDAKVLFRRWNAEQQQILDILKDYFHYNDYNNIKDIVGMYVYEHYDNNATIKGLSEQETEELTPYFFDNIINSVTYCVAKRSNIQIDENELFKNFSNITNELQLRLMGSVVNDFSNDILRVIEYKIRQRNREVKDYAKTRKIWSEDKKEYGGELSVQIPRVSDGWNNNGQTIGEGERNSTEETRDRERIKGQIQETSNERISSYSKIQSNDRGNDRGIATKGDRGENLEVGINPTSFNLQESLFDESYTTMQDKEEIFASDDIVIEDNEQNNIIDLQIQEEQKEKINYHIPEDFTKQYNLKVKYKENIEAIKVLKEIEANDRMATAEEQEILAKYNGWGGLSKAFDKNAPEWKAEYTELQELLTDNEYERARATVLDSFYTDKTIIKAMYKGLERLGFKKGNILEPSAGIGNFIGNLPQSMEKSKFTAIEIDNLTGRILKQLYQKEQVYIQGYEKTDLQDDFYDIAISNVPFGNIGVSDKRYNKENLKIHDYFFAKSIDKVRNSGIIAFITSSNTMDKLNPSAREYIAKRAELLGAIRLPTNAFRTVANTDVTTDIIFLQKREQMLEAERPSWVDVANATDEIYINTYFKMHPEMIMGNFKETTNQFNQKIYDVVYDKEKQNLEEMLAEAISKLPEDVYKEIERDENETEEYIIAPDDIKNNSYAVIDDNLYYKENSLMKLVDKRALTKERIIGMIRVRDALDKLIDIQSKDISDEDIKPYQDKLNHEYDQFIKKYGIINSSANKSAFEEDIEYQLICALENVNEETKEATKTDIFYKRTIEPNKTIENVETSDEALIVSLNQKGYVDLDYMAEISNRDTQTLIEELESKIYRNPLVEEKNINKIEVGWETAEEYLSGDVVKKLAIAEAKANDNAMYLQNVRALKKVQPVRLEASDIEVKLRCYLDTNLLYRTIRKREI